MNLKTIIYILENKLPYYTNPMYNNIISLYIFQVFLIIMYIIYASAIKKLTMYLIVIIIQSKLQLI